MLIAHIIVSSIYNILSYCFVKKMADKIEIEIKIKISLKVRKHRNRNWNKNKDKY